VNRPALGSCPLLRAGRGRSRFPNQPQISPLISDVNFKLPSTNFGIIKTANLDLGQQLSPLVVSSQSCFWNETSMAYQANASPFQSWRPFAREPAISLTQNLAPEIDAKILLLGCGDARNILFTIFTDENERIASLFFTQYWRTDFNRSYDFTCCDIEPAILGLTVYYFLTNFST